MKLDPTWRNRWPAERVALVAEHDRAALLQLEGYMLRDAIRTWESTEIVADVASWLERRSTDATDAEDGDANVPLSWVHPAVRAEVWAVVRWGVAPDREQLRAVARDRLPTNVTLRPAIREAAKLAAKARGLSLSRWLERAAQAQLLADARRRAVSTGQGGA